MAKNAVASAKPNGRDRAPEKIAAPTTPLPAPTPPPAPHAVLIAVLREAAIAPLHMRHLHAVDHARWTRLHDAGLALADAVERGN